MIHLYEECTEPANGLNFYRWRDRRYSIGCVLRLGDFVLQFRYAHHIRRLYLQRWRHDHG